MSSKCLAGVETHGENYKLYDKHVRLQRNPSLGRKLKIIQSYGLIKTLKKKAFLIVKWNFLFWRLLSVKTALGEKSKISFSA